jgi:16S rRNA (cytosine1402-N4)-methyltransferase
MMAERVRAHEPVLLEEVMGWLEPRPGGRYCDATVGLAGHARAILERSSPDGRLVGLDRDRDALAAARGELEAFGDRVTLVHAPFSRAREVLEGLEVVPVDGLLVDLGVSSPQLDRPERGFSFRNSGPLDMRMDQAEGETVGELLRRVDEVELARIIRDYGEERYAGRIARAIIEARDAAALDSTASSTSWTGCSIRSLTACAPAAGSASSRSTRWRIGSSSGACGRWPGATAADLPACAS